MHGVHGSKDASPDMTIKIRCNAEAAATDLADVSYGKGGDGIR